MRHVSLLAAVLIIGVAHPTQARAATASVGPPNSFGQVTVRYVADPGEANDVSVQFSPSSAPAGFDIEIKDSGATITSGSGCSSVSPTRVQCQATSGDLFNAALGDGNDILSISRFLDTGGGRLSGGDGDDRIRGNDTAGTNEILLGGQGDDTLFGRGGSEFLDGGPGADDLSGGTSCEALLAEVCLADIDTVSYRGRTKRVHATADGFAGDDGQPGEGDTIMPDVERIIGGQGNDTLGGTTMTFQSIGNGFAHPIRLVGMQLVGRAGDDVLNGFRGPDTLTGESGDDVLRGAGGRDKLRGGRGRDRLLADDGHRDHVNGGRGRDEGRIDPGLDHVRSVERFL